MNRYLKLNLVTKISILVLLSGFISQFVQIASFEYFLKQNYKKESSLKIHAALKDLKNVFKGSEQNLLKNLSYINKNRSILASIYFVNNYQNKTSYDAVLLDEEKKRIASELLDRVKISSNNIITLYDANKELLAYVIKQNDKYQQNFISYENGKAILFSKYEDQLEYKKRDLKQNDTILLRDRINNKSFYNFVDDKLIISAYETLIENDLVVGYIKLEKIYAKNYFKELSAKEKINIDVSNTISKLQTNKIISFFEQKEDINLLQEDDKNIILTRSIKSEKDDIFISFHLNKEIVLQQIEENRKIFLTITFSMLMVIIVFLVVLLKKTLSKPLDTIMQQIEYIKNSEYDKFKSIKTKDELEVILNNLHELSQTIKLRENEIRKQAYESLQKDKILADKEKLAAMGEMIGNIAHQWRQPLSVIKTLSSSMNFQQELGILKEEEVKHSTQEISYRVEYLSETIDTFRNYLKEKKELKEVVLQDRINTALKIVNVTLVDNHIDLIQDIEKEPIIITMVVGELEQVVINIINNAKDILLEKQIENPKITILVASKNDQVTITIEDNAGGIPQDILPNIFDEYFSTKGDSGTGLGLHMSSRIIEESLKGKLYAKNTQNGAKFYIEFPLKRA